MGSRVRSVGIVVAAVALTASAYWGWCRYEAYAEERRLMAPVEEARARRAAEAARWAGLTPEQQAAELAKRRAAEEDRIATQAAAEARAAEIRAAAVEEARRARVFVDARSLCRGAIREALHDPWTAKWDPEASWHMSSMADGTLLVRPSLRAKNALGAYVKSTWLCRVRDGNEGLQLQALAPV